MLCHDIVIPIRRFSLRMFLLVTVLVGYVFTTGGHHHRCMCGAAHVNVHVHVILRVSMSDMFLWALGSEGHLANGADHHAHQTHHSGGAQEDGGESDRNGRVGSLLRSGVEWTRTVLYVNRVERVQTKVPCMYVCMYGEALKGNINACIHVRMCAHLCMYVCM